MLLMMGRRRLGRRMLQLTIRWCRLRMRFVVVLVVLVGVVQ